MMGSGIRPPLSEPMQQFNPTPHMNQPGGLTGTGLGLGMNTMPSTTGLGMGGGLGGFGGPSSHHGLGTAGLGSHMMIPSGAFQSFHDSWPNMMHPGPMGMNMTSPNFQLNTNAQLQNLGRSATPSNLTPGQLLQQQQERRNTWSGLSSSNADLLGVRHHHNQASRRNTEITGNPSFPSSWFEEDPVAPNVEEEGPSSKTRPAPHTKPKPSRTKS